MKDLYYIGEAAEILNISTQTLRYYDKIGILQPAFTDPKTGYRKYTYDQISFADRIRHLQKLGLRLDEITTAIQGNSVASLLKMLEKKHAQTEAAILRETKLLDELQWYISYYRHTNKTAAFNTTLPYLTHEPARYLLAEPIEGDAIYGSGHKLMRRKNSRPYRQLTVLRQNGYLLDFTSLINGSAKPTHYFIMLREKPDFEDSYIHTIPAGNYLCFHTRLLSDDFKTNTITQYFKSAAPPPFVLANEYEDNFNDFRNCPYELQIPVNQNLALPDF